jgi:hypothetical protein
VAARWLTEPHRAGLLAGVAVYPLTRLAGTVPRPPVDRGVVSGVTMAAAYVAASTVTSVVRWGATGTSAESPHGALRSCASCLALAAGAGTVAARSRREARMAAPDRRRVSLPGATVGALAELLALSAGAGLVVAAADAARGRLPSVLRPGTPVVTGLGVAAAGMATTLAVRRPRVQAWLSLPSPDGAQGEATHFIPHRNLPMAVAGSAAVAAAAVGVARLETWTAAEVARMFSSKPDPGSLAELVGQAAVSTGVALAGLAAFTLYSSRVSVQQSVFESAYAEIPTRGGVTGGPGSAGKDAGSSRRHTPRTSSAPCSAARRPTRCAR